MILAKICTTAQLAMEFSIFGVKSQMAEIIVAYRP